MLMIFGILSKQYMEYMRSLYTLAISSLIVVQRLHGGVYCLEELLFLSPSLTSLCTFFSCFCPLTSFLVASTMNHRDPLLLGFIAAKEKLEKVHQIREDLYALRRDALKSWS
jgi:hypothetical protein